MDSDTTTRKQTMIDQTAIVHQDVRPGRSVAIRLTEGMAVESTDGAVGEIADVVIDPVRRASPIWSCNAATATIRPA
jgi:hypothetical protein